MTGLMCNSALMSIKPSQGLNYFTNTTLTHLVENHPMYQKNIDKEVADAEIIVFALILLDDELFI